MLDLTLNPLRGDFAAELNEISLSIELSFLFSCELKPLFQGVGVILRCKPLLLLT